MLYLCVIMKNKVYVGNWFGCVFFLGSEKGTGAGVGTETFGGNLGAGTVMGEGRRIEHGSLKLNLLPTWCVYTY